MKLKYIKNNIFNKGSNMIVLVFRVDYVIVNFYFSNYNLLIFIRNLFQIQILKVRVIQILNKCSSNRVIRMEIK